MQDSPETDITCKKNDIDRRPFICKARLIYKSCKRGYFLISNKCCPIQYYNEKHRQISTAV